jgi:hypothetical protein
MDKQATLDALTEQVRAAVTEQRQDGDPAHEDWYTWGWVLSDVTAQLEHLSRVLGEQVRRYGERRILRDDEGMDPTERAGRTDDTLRELARCLHEANLYARAFHSEASHIAVEVDPQ